MLENGRVLSGPRCPARLVADTQPPLDSAAQALRAPQDGYSTLSRMPLRMHGTSANMDRIAARACQERFVPVNEVSVKARGPRLKLNLRVHRWAEARG